MKIKKILAVVLVLAMLTALLPTAALAAEGDEEGDSTTTSSGVELSKTATLEEDGTYTIKLEAYATGEVKTTTETAGVPCDIVLVLDQSTSMVQPIDNTTVTVSSANTELGKIEGYYGYKTTSNSSTTYYIVQYREGNNSLWGWYYRSTSTTNGTDWYSLNNNNEIYVTRLGSLKDAATTFIENVQQNAAENNVDHKIAVVGFGGDGSTGTPFNATELLSTEDTVAYASSSSATASTITQAQYQDALVSVNVNNSVNSRLTTAIERVRAGSYTYANYGMELAKGVLDNRAATTYTAPDGTRANRKTIVVFFTDGYPGRHNTTSFMNAEKSGSNSYVVVETANKTIQVSNSLKAAGTTVYSVGVLDGANPAADYNFTTSTKKSDFNNTSFDVTTGYLTSVQAVNAYLHFVSSDYGAVEGTPTMETYDRSKVVNNGYYLAASSAEDLKKVFETISSSIGSSSTTCTLNADSVLKDVISSRFALPEDFSANSNVTVQTADYQGDGKFGTAQTLNATVSVEGKTISVSGFDYSSNYVVDASGTVPTSGKKLIVTIEGVLPTDSAVTGEAVNTNARTSGIYANASATTAAAVFPRPQTILTSKSYVLDYAKTADLGTLGLGSVKSIVNAFQAVTGSDNSVTGTYGKAALNNSTVTYTPKTTNWKGYDSFYAFGTTTDEAITAVEANANGNLWSKINVIPANNVYYEDDFVSSETSGTVGIVYTGTWTTDGTSAGNTETANGDVQGWETSLADDTSYSDGSAHKAVASVENTATATFTFTGTGVDIYSRTNMDTGTILVILTDDPEDSTVSKALSVDNKAASGDYYQIPTATFDGLDYGTYTVTLYVTTAAEGRCTYYLDGIRVYNPIQALEDTDTTVQAAYGEAELNATFTEVRDLLEKDYTAFIDEGNNADGNPSGNATTGDYMNTEIGKIAPEHEIYLAPGQSVVINAAGGSNYYIGLKSPTGKNVTAEISSGIYEGTDSKSSVSISHTTDLYYKVTPNSNSTITIKNVTDDNMTANGSSDNSNILSITKLRVTGTDADAATGQVLTNEQALQAYTAFQSYALVAYDADSVVEEELPEETTEPEVSEPETPAEEEPGEVVIENPEEYDKDDSKDNNQGQPDAKQVVRDWVENLFKNIKNLFGRH